MGFSNDNSTIRPGSAGRSGGSGLSGDTARVRRHGAQFGLRSLMLVTAGSCVLFAVLKAAGATMLQASIGMVAIALFCGGLIAFIEIVSLFRRKGDWQGRDPYYGGRPSLWSQWSGRYVEPDEAPRRPAALDFSGVPDENIEWLGDVHSAVVSRLARAIPQSLDRPDGQGIDWAEGNGDHRGDEAVPDESCGAAIRDDRMTS